MPDSRDGPRPSPVDPAGFARARILVIGDVMLDRYVHGEVGRLSPEAPVPVLEVGETRLMAGGAGNVARNVASLGGRAELLSVTGGDAAGRELRALLAAESGITVRLFADEARRTTVKTRYMARSRQVLRADEEDRAPVRHAIAEALIAAAHEAAPRAHVMVLSDYAKGVLSKPVVMALGALARERGIPLIADPKPHTVRHYKGADILTPNRDEAAAALGLARVPEEGLADRLEALRRELDLGALLLTCGEDGMMLATSGGHLLEIPAARREVFDVSGAGDSVVAALAVALAAGHGLEGAARIANLAGGIAVSKPGTAAVLDVELAAESRHDRLAPFERKILTASKAEAHVAAWRAEGLAVAFTNGCFDLLHPGHIALLREARAAADRLVVGLNSDASARRLKGAGRPVQDEAARAIVLASLADVDGVVLFDEDTPLALLERLRPDLLVKGADYRPDEVVGRSLVEGYGGRVMLARIAPGYSTSTQIRRMKA